MVTNKKKMVILKLSNLKSNKVQYDSTGESDQIGAVPGSNKLQKLGNVQQKVNRNVYHEKSQARNLRYLEFSPNLINLKIIDSIGTVSFQ